MIAQTYHHLCDFGLAMLRNVVWTKMDGILSACKPYFLKSHKRDASRTLDEELEHMLGGKHPHALERKREAV